MIGSPRNGGFRSAGGLLLPTLEGAAVALHWPGPASSTGSLRMFRRMLFSYGQDIEESRSHTLTGLCFLSFRGR